MHIYLFNFALPSFFFCFLSQGKTQTMFNLLHNYNENILHCLSSERVLAPPQCNRCDFPKERQEAQNSENVILVLH